MTVKELMRELLNFDTNNEVIIVKDLKEVNFTLSLEITSVRYNGNKVVLETM